MSLPMLLMLLFVIATGLLLAGLRGKRLDRHPYCRHCKFDLAGLCAPVGFSLGGVAQCPECGTRFSNRPWRIRHGRREQVKWMIWSGASVWIGLVIIVAGFISTGGSASKWNKNMPTALLLAQAWIGGPASAESVIDELVSRYSAKALGPESEAAMLSAIVRAQGDMNVPWNVAWGSLVERAAKAGKISDSLWSQYLRQSFGVQLSTSSTLLSGIAVPLEVNITWTRFGAAMQAPRVRFRATAAAWDGPGEVELLNRSEEEAQQVIVSDAAIASTGGAIMLPNSPGQRRIIIHITASIADNLVTQSVNTIERVLTSDVKVITPESVGMDAGLRPLVVRSKLGSSPDPNAFKSSTTGLEWPTKQDPPLGSVIDGIIASPSVTGPGWVLTGTLSAGVELGGDKLRVELIVLGERIAAQTELFSQSGQGDLTFTARWQGAPPAFADLVVSAAPGATPPDRLFAWNERRRTITGVTVTAQKVTGTNGQAQPSDLGGLDSSSFWERAKRDLEATPR